MIASRIESILFTNGEPITRKRLAAVLDVSEDSVREAAGILRHRHEDDSSGLILIELDDAMELSTAPKNASLVESFVAKDREEGLGKATLEVLSVIAYRAPVTRSEIDAIRGVNSSFALRNLLLRGLIERETNPLDTREYRYSPSFRMLELLGIGSVSELPDHASLSSDERAAGLVSASEEVKPDDSESGSDPLSADDDR